MVKHDVAECNIHLNNHNFRVENEVLDFAGCEPRNTDTIVFTEVLERSSAQVAVAQNNSTAVYDGHAILRIPSNNSN